MVYATLTEGNMTGHAFQVFTVVNVCDHSCQVLADGRQTIFLFFGDGVAQTIVNWFRT